MKRFTAYRLQKVLVFSFIIAAILLFVTGLGFMTNFYPLFYNGTNDMYDYYKTLQLFNKVMFKAAVTIVVMGFLLLGFDIHKEKNGLFGTIYVVGITYYVFSMMSMILNAIPFYKGKYEALDFTLIDNYQASNFAFNVSQTVATALLVISVLLLVIVIFRQIKSFKMKRGVKHD